MKRILLLTFLSVFVALSGFATDVTIATFNAEFLNRKKVHMKFGLPFDITRASESEQDFWSNEENRTAKLEEASANVAQFLREINADILTLTEVGTKEDLEVLHAELKKLDLTYQYREVCDCTDPYTGQKVAIFSKYPLKDVWYQIPGRAMYLEETDGDSEGETGISKGMKATVTIKDKDYDIFVLHLKSERGGYDSDAKRLAQANIARRAIIQQLNLGRHVIVTGDLNSEKGTESIYRIRGFDDVYEELIQTGSTQYFKDYGVRWTYNYKGEPEQIDHILISHGIAAKDGIQTSIIVTGDENVSDHNPVIVKLTLL